MALILNIYQQICSSKSFDGAFIIIKSYHLEKLAISFRFSTSLGNLSTLSAMLNNAETKLISARILASLFRHKRTGNVRTFFRRCWAQPRHHRFLHHTTLEQLKRKQDQWIKRAAKLVRSQSNMVNASGNQRLCSRLCWSTKRWLTFLGIIVCLRSRPSPPATIQRSQLVKAVQKGSQPTWVSVFGLHLYRRKPVP